ncbi:ParA family protein [Candidatus Woesearchaeota archaeon]|nr:ParA family protein [Candidatus Woesearchaeota archaeon]
MRSICIMNHKGGVGKTTTAINLAAGISRQDRKVLLIDLDPQGNIDLSLRVKAENNIYDAMTGDATLSSCIVNIAKNLDIISSTETLTKAEYYLYKQDDSRMMLKRLLSMIDGYDFIIIDCPPSLGIMNQNVLAFCKEVFVPTSTDFLGMDALKKMTKVIEKVNESYGNNCEITKVIPTLFDRRNKICKQTLEEIKQEFNGLASNPIRMNSKLKEAPKNGKSIFAYAKSSPGAKDYGVLVDDVLSMKSAA